MERLDYKQLGQMIKVVFLNDQKYQVNKTVPAFQKDGKYVGDLFSLVMLELDGENPPIFYHTYSPYDVISSKTSDWAAVFRSGERVLDFEFTPYMLQRTGVMTSLVLNSLGTDSLVGKKVLYIGTGRIARHDLEALKVYYPELAEVSFINNGQSSGEFIDFAKDLGVKASLTSLENIGEFDVIICHSSSKTPILTKELMVSIKDGALITTFSSEDFTEVATDYFDTLKATIIVDWDQTIDEAPELNQAVKDGRTDINSVVTLKELFSEDYTSRADKDYFIYRSHGTPMQNLAALKLILSQES